MREDRPTMPHAQDANELRRIACALAQLGHDTARQFFGAATVTRKDDDTPVTQADHAAQAAILDKLAVQFPDHAVLTEEDLVQPERHAAIGSAALCWVVDPLDGTRNFARGVGIYAVSVAVMDDSGSLAGAVFDATTGRVYSAARGQGAFVDEHPLVMQNRPVDSDTTVMLSSFRRRAIPAAVRAWMDEYLYRNQGSLCLHLAWVAAGLADAAYALECKLWDIAAAVLIIQESGGVATDHAGGSLWPIVLASYRDQDIPILVGTPTMHARLLKSLMDGAGDSCP
jgi:myo-inositol-1(or 4)-monophosphatase